MCLAGYREACTIARDRLETVSVDHSAEPDAFREDLMNIARTTLSSKILTQVCLPAGVLSPVQLQRQGTSPCSGNHEQQVQPVIADRCGVAACICLLTPGSFFS